MNEIGEIIRKILFFKNININSFAKHIGISQKTLENVIYGNNSKKENIEKISQGLGVDLFKYINKDPATILNKPALNMALYKKASFTLQELIENKNLDCPKDQFEALTTILYEFLLSNNDVTDANINFFAQGMIEHALNNFMMTQKIS